jgi:hypothetical protein
MGIKDILRKKAPGPCVCEKETASYRCPVCHKEFCKACVQRSSEILGESGTGSHIKVSIASGGLVNTGASRGIESRVQERMEAMRKVVRGGGGVCLTCSIEKGRAIALKKL